METTNFSIRHPYDDLLNRPIVQQIIELKPFKSRTGIAVQARFGRQFEIGSLDMSGSGRRESFSSVNSTHEIAHHYYHQPQQT